MRDSEIRTIKDNLFKAQQRLDLEDLDEQDVEKAHHKVEKAKEELEKIIG